MTQKMIHNHVITIKLYNMHFKSNSYKLHHNKMMTQKLQACDYRNWITHAFQSLKTSSQPSDDTNGTKNWGWIIDLSADRQGQKRLERGALSTPGSPLCYFKVT